MSTPHVTGSTLLQAREALSTFVRERCAAARSELGFGWVAVPDAPATYADLLTAFNHSRQTGAPLPASSLDCADTIFTSPSDNIAFRFWHDTSHCRLGLTFSLPDEWRLTVLHLNELENAGFGLGTDEYRLLRFDLLGQLILLGVAGRFPLNQGQFTRRCARLGLDIGVLAELEKG